MDIYIPNDHQAELAIHEGEDSIVVGDKLYMKYDCYLDNKVNEFYTSHKYQVRFEYLMNIINDYYKDKHYKYTGQKFLFSLANLQTRIHMREDIKYTIWVRLQV